MIGFCFSSSGHSQVKLTSGAKWLTYSSNYFSNGHILLVIGSFLYETSVFVQKYGTLYTTVEVANWELRDCEHV